VSSNPGNLGLQMPARSAAERDEGPGLPARLCYRLRRHSGRKGECRSLSETDCIRLLDGAHQILKAPLIVVWDRLSTHISKTVKALVAERDWLTVVLLPVYAPDLNPVEGLWARIKQGLANLAALSELETLLRRRLKAFQHRNGPRSRQAELTLIRRSQQSAWSAVTWCSQWRVRRRLVSSTTSAWSAACSLTFAVTRGRILRR
jgi:transposase